MRIRQLRERGIEVMILSSEINPVVKARRKKMGIEAIDGMGLNEKGEALNRFLAEKNSTLHRLFMSAMISTTCLALISWAGRWLWLTLIRRLFAPDILFYRSPAVMGQ